PASRPWLGCGLEPELRRRIEAVHLQSRPAAKRYGPGVPVHRRRSAFRYLYSQSIDQRTRSLVAPPAQSILPAAETSLAPCDCQAADCLPPMFAKQNWNCTTGHRQIVRRSATANDELSDAAACSCEWLGRVVFQTVLSKTRRPEKRFADERCQPISPHWPIPIHRGRQN